MDRRDFLKGSLLLLGASLSPFFLKDLLGFGKTSAFYFTYLKYPGKWDLRNGSDHRLLWEISKRTSIRCREEYETHDLATAGPIESPFLCLCGENELPVFSKDQIARLRRFFQAGGFLLADSLGSEADYGFDKSFRALMRTLFPNTPLQKIPPDHVIYKSFYLLKKPYGRVQQTDYLEGITLTDRTLVIYSQNDLFGAWSRDKLGNWDFQCEPEGETQREYALRTGLNLVMYTLCLNYKADQVHVPFIMKRRRLLEEK